MKNTYISLAIAMMLNMVEANSFKGDSPLASFENMSDNKNAWDYDKNGSTAGAVIGFTVFGVAYVFVIIMLMLDVTNKIKEYSEEIENDKIALSELSFDYNSEEVKE